MIRKNSKKRKERMRLRTRRLSVVLIALIGVAAWIFINPESYDTIFTRIENTGAEAGIIRTWAENLVESIGDSDGGGLSEIGTGNLENGNEDSEEANSSSRLAKDVLEKLEVKGRAPKTGYTREQFYDGWPLVDGCSLRQRILKRELGETAVLDGCNVITGEFDEPYTGKHLVLTTREEVSKIQIDHVVALSDAWQKGAQYSSKETRFEIATDPLNLLAVDGEANMKKSDGDAATWLPSNKKFRCQYVARQVSVKYKYGLWVTSAEKEAILRVLENCPNERAVGI